MIKIEYILKQSWRILWSYRVLWIFGLLLALTGAGGGRGGSNPNFNFGDNRPAQPMPQEFPALPGDAPQWLREFVEWFEQSVVPLFEHPEAHVTTFVWIGVALLLFILVVSLLMALVRYPAETAVMRMVNDYEESGTKVGFRTGWRLGWNRRAFRLWVIDLILALPALVFVLLLLALGALFFAGMIASREQQPALLFGGLAALIFFLVALLFFIVLMVFLGLLRQFFARAATLDGLGVREALRSGWTLFRQQWKSAGLMWLVMVGISIAVGIAMIVAFFVLIPVYLILLLPAALLAALPFLVGFGIASLFAATPLALIIGGLLALPVFFAVLFSPLLLLTSWYLLYDIIVWTLTYREIKALSAPSLLAEAPPLPEQNPPEPPSA